MKSQIEKFYISAIVYSYCQNFNDVFRVGERKRLWEDRSAQPREDKEAIDSFSSFPLNEKIRQTPT